MSTKLWAAGLKRERFTKEVERILYHSIFHIVKNHLKNKHKVEQHKAVVDKESHSIKIKQSVNGKNKDKDKDSKSSG